MLCSSMKAYADTRIGEPVLHVVGSHGEEALETGRAGRSWDRYLKASGEIGTYLSHGRKLF